MTRAPVSGSDTLQVRRAHFRGDRRGQVHRRRRLAGWIVLAVIVVWLLVAGAALVANG